MLRMSKKEFIPIPPPAPIPPAEKISAQQLGELYRSGEADIICVMGPTASGKTRYAVNLARQLGGAEIISADSRQVYRRMDIGSGKDLDEYGEIPYHLIDIVPAGERYNICRYQRDFSAAYRDCLQRGVVPILCGGSGLYVEAATKKGYDMPENSALDLVLPQKPFYLATVIDRQSRRDRIDARLDERLSGGMIEEVRGLLESGVSEESLIRYGLEYKFVTLYLTGKMDYSTMRTGLQNAIHQFAKRQMTWLRGMERDGVTIHWVKAV